MMPTPSSPGMPAMPHRTPPSRFARLRLAIVVPFAAVAMVLVAAPAAQAAKVYRCPDGSYADKPCGEGQRVVTTTKRYTAVPGEDKECVAMADDAEELANGKAGGVTSAQALRRIDEAGLPYEQRTLRKKFVVKIYQTTGTPAEVRSLVEADCVSDKKAAAKTAAAEKAAADKAAADQAARAASAQPSGTGGTAVAGGPSKSQCEEIKRTLAMLRKRQQDGAGAEAMDQMKGEQRDTEKQLAGLCPQ